MSLTLIIRGSRFTNQGFTRSVSRELVNFSKDDFMQLLNNGRNIIQQLNHAKINHKDKIDKDLLLIHLTANCIECFTAINTFLIQLVFSFLNNEIDSNSLFHTIHFDL